MSQTVLSGTGIVLDQRHGNQNPHCFLVLTPEAEGKLVIANFTTIKESTAPAWTEIVVGIGEHPFVTAPSCIPLGLVKLVSHQKFIEVSQVENTVIYGKMDLSLHIKIINKLLESSHTSPEITEFIIKNFGEKKYQIVKSCVMDVNQSV